MLWPLLTCAASRSCSAGPSRSLRRSVIRPSKSRASECASKSSVPNPRPRRITNGGRICELVNVARNSGRPGKFAASISDRCGCLSRRPVHLHLTLTTICTYATSSHELSMPLSSAARSAVVSIASVCSPLSLALASRSACLIAPVSTLVGARCHVVARPAARGCVLLPCRACGQRPAVYAHCGLPVRACAARTY